MMAARLVRVVWVTVAIVACHAGIARAQATVASWLDEPTPASWNTPGLPVPAAPKVEGPVDSRCRAEARPQELDEDRRLRSQGWDLVGGYSGGWQVLVIRATAGYDGMCRPRQYQEFVFVKGTFAGTLSPDAMNSRADGALTRMWLQSSSRLTAEYARYAATDPLCCPSKTTTVVFDVSNDPPVLRPVSASTIETAEASATAATSPLDGTSWQLVRFQGSDGTTLTPDDRAKYTIQFGADGRLTARIDCNRGRGTWMSSGPNRIELGPLALTRAQCPAGSLHDHIVRQWGNIRSYLIRDGRLFLALMADGGIYELEPM